MLLAVETEVPFKHYSFSEAIKLIKETGFDAVDIDFCEDATALLCNSDYKERAYELKDLLSKYDLSCNQAHAPYNFTYGMAMDESEPVYLTIMRSIEAAGIIGIDHIVLHGVKTPQPAASKASFDYNYRYIKSFEPYCEAAGVKIAFENTSYAYRFPDLMNIMMEKLDSPWYSVLVDIGHVLESAGMQPGEFIRSLDSGILAGLHIHDNHIAPNCDEHLLPYLGKVDFPDFLRALKETGYQGDFTMEACGYLNTYAEHGLLKEAMVFEAATGRKLIADYQAL